MQTELRLETKDGFFIYGTHDSAGSSAIIIFVHGLSGNKDEHQYYNAARFFANKGFDVFRFDFYARKPDARPLVDSSITTHAEDLKTVIDSFKDKYKKIVLVGHSFGPLAILNTDLSSISKMVFWDPTGRMDKIEDKRGSYNPKLDKYVLHWGMDIIIGKKLVEEWKRMDLEELIKKITIPCKFIFAGKYNKYDIWKPFLGKIKIDNEFTIIKKATHGFTEEGCEEELFEETLKWIEG